MKKEQLALADWHRANRLLCAKILSELSYEEAIVPISQTNQRGVWQLEEGAAQWEFSAHRTLWGMLLIDPDSLCRRWNSEVTDVLAGQLLIDLHPQLGCSELIMGNLLEEIGQTLWCDLRLLTRRRGLTAEAWLALPRGEREGLLDGHPKVIANKGRLGWGELELVSYSPESGQSLRLHWLAIARELVDVGMETGMDNRRLLETGMPAKQAERLLARIKGDPAHYWIMAVHPWQFERIVRPHYAQLMMGGQMQYLGEGDDLWLPQQSIRTLSNLSQPHAMDIKLSLCILNTSCYRGIPGKYITQGARLSQQLANLVSSDPLLSTCRLEVLQERAGIHCPHPLQRQLPAAPYRYHELLGCIWRDSIVGRLQTGEDAMLIATLMQRDERGSPLVATLIRQSAMGADRWLETLFEHVVIPLYHLLCCYGIGLIAHGQNLVLILKDQHPVGMAIKDFHGDMRLVDRPFPELAAFDEDILATLTRLPPAYLLHDLVTGHFATVLRFISPLLQSVAVDETSFYGLLGKVIRRYMANQPDLAERFTLFPLFEPQILRVCINLARLEAGYGDSAERPLPQLGAELDNPLWLAEQD